MIPEGICRAMIESELIPVIKSSVSFSSERAASVIEKSFMDPTYVRSDIIFRTILLINDSD